MGRWCILDAYAGEALRVKDTLLILSVGILGWFTYLHQRTIREQARQIEDLRAKATIETKSGSLELQDRCAKQALLEYRLEGYEKEKLAAFTNHYNPKVNKCFMRVDNTDTTTQRGIIIVSKTLSDAFEHKEYGQYFWRTDGKKKYWEVEPYMCSVTLPSGEKKTCHSDDEFDTLTKVYME